jgi:hypothetical protein
VTCVITLVIHEAASSCILAPFACLTPFCSISGAILRSTLEPWELMHDVSPQARMMQVMIPPPKNTPDQTVICIHQFGTHMADTGMRENLHVKTIVARAMKPHNGTKTPDPKPLWHAR